jgi:hypothetical protein
VLSVRRKPNCGSPIGSLGTGPGFFESILHYAKAMPDLRTY